MTTIEYSGLIVGELIVEEMENKKNRNKRMKKFISALEKEVKADSEKFLENGVIKAFDEFLASSESVVDSKDHAAKILVNLILENNYLPNISRAVDCMNVVSIKSGLTISMWDSEKINGNIIYKNSQGGEKYWPFMGEEVELLDNELAAFDEEKVLCLVRYRDSKYAPIMEETTKMVVHIQGVEGISKERVENALNELEQLLIENVGAKISKKEIIRK
ncbi:hypothetical protein IIC68_00935 [archaeon]|nr:hypothetical protein [archaeon]